MDDPTLVQLNDRFVVAERGRDVEFFRHVLADGLVFRRADGTRVDKETYLQALADPGNRYEVLANEDVEAILFDEATALVSVRVHAKGVRAGGKFEGTFRNTRLFVRQHGEWRCAVWFNTESA